MTTDTLHPLATEYVKRLRRVARRLPPERRTELVAEIESHLAEALDPRAAEPEARDVIERLGTPETIVAAEQPASTEPAGARGTKEMAAVLLLLFGGFIAGIGWLVGVVLLWTSSAWTTREKWVGTLFVPGGLATPFIILGVRLTRESCVRTAHGSEHCTTDGRGQIILIVISAILVLASIASAKYLTSRARRAS